MDIPEIIRYAFRIAEIVKFCSTCLVFLSLLVFISGYIIILSMNLLIWILRILGAGRQHVNINSNPTDTDRDRDEKQHEGKSAQLTKSNKQRPVTTEPTKTRKNATDGVMARRKRDWKKMNIGNAVGKKGRRDTKNDRRFRATGAYKTTRGEKRWDVAAGKQRHQDMIGKGSVARVHKRNWNQMGKDSINESSKGYRNEMDNDSVAGSVKRDQKKISKSSAIWGNKQDWRDMSESWRHWTPSDIDCESQLEDAMPETHPEKGMET